ncbi:MAG: hypothetical protein ATN35_03740 [Epulopiscium sp. Nele67-Bin004]|nr:MAG: hypothetical protein ATN35_03740 [Epulopiscium sp. Nele67-Bin004]
MPLIDEYINHKIEALGLNITKVSSGVSYYTIMYKIASGELSPDKFLIDTILQRIGIERFDLEWYIPHDEYTLYENRTKVMQLIKNNQLGDAEKIISQYDQKNKLHNLHKQFKLYATALIAEQKGEPPQTLVTLYKDVISETVPEFEKVQLKDLLLSKAEVCFILEYAYHLKSVDYDKSIQLYLEMLKFFDCPTTSIWIKSIYYQTVITNLENYYISQSEDAKLIELCDKAIVCFRRRYLFGELTVVLKIKMNATKRINKIDNDYPQMESWYNTIVGIYEEHGVTIKFDTKYKLYKWENTYCVADVIKDRRTMLGLSQAKLAKDICTTQTVFRAENRKCNPHQATTKLLLQKLGLIGDLCVDRVPYVDLETLNLDLKIRREFVKQNYKTVNKELEQLTNKVDMTDKNNIQCIGHKVKIIEFRNEDITTEQYYEYLIEALGLTANIENILQKPREIHLSYNELELIANIILALDIMKKHEEALKWLKILEQYVDKTNWEILSIDRYIYFANIITSIYGNVGKFDWSNSGSYETLVPALNNNSWQGLSTTIYGLGWNIRQEVEIVQNRTMTQEEQKKYIDIMKTVYILSEIAGNTNRQHKIKQLIRPQTLGHNHHG